MDGSTSIICPKYEKPLKKAFYNGIALLLIIACSFFAWGSFVILEQFLKPLFWALLCGSVLHPLKHKLSSCFKAWIIWMEETEYRLPICLEILSWPLKLFLDLSDSIGFIIFKYWVKICCCLVLLVVMGTIYSYTPTIVISLIWKVVNCLLTMLCLATDIFQNTALVITMLLAFLLTLTFYWDSNFYQELLIASYIVWFGISCYIASFFPYMKFIILISFQILFLAGFIISGRSASFNSDSGSKNDATSDGNKNKSDGMKDNDHQDSENTHLSKSSIDMENVGNMKTLLHQIGFYSCNNTSDKYISWVSMACLVTLALQSGWLPYCIALLILVYAIRHLCRSFGISDFIGTQCNAFKQWIFEWYSLRKGILIPPPISCLDTIFKQMRVHLLHFLKESSDSAASVMVILALLLFVIFGSIFLIIQAYAEGMYMVKVGGSVINQTVVHNPELTQLLPEGWENKLDSVLNNAYTYGRQALSKLVRNMLSGVSEEKTEELEKRALEVWDRVYQAWMMNAIEQKTTIGPQVTSTAVYQTWENFIDAMHKTPELVSMSALTQLAQNNMAMLTSGLESVWELVRGNASLVTSAFLTVLTVVFSHSFAVLNFCISMIVFLTALFYLLSSSRQFYKPVEVITTFSPVFGSRLAFAMENAVNEVLTASFKLALFYGMWTWLIHSLFQMNIIYIPSVLAAMLAVVPALGTYWACLPAVVDLWLAQGKTIHAITLAVCQFIPTLFVDATIYTEINEGHPYLTGLSVAGGLFCMGMEGAIIGPMILCCLYVVVSLSGAIMQETATATPTPERLSPRFLR